MQLSNLLLLEWWCMFLFLTVMHAYCSVSTQLCTLNEKSIITLPLYFLLLFPILTLYHSFFPCLFFAGRQVSMGEARWASRPDTSPPPFVLAIPNITTILANMTSTSQLLGLAEEGLRCDQEIERRYEIVPSVVCSMCCLFGIIYCFFGKWSYSHLCCSWADVRWYKYSCALNVATESWIL